MIWTRGFFTVANNNSFGRILASKNDKLYGQEPGHDLKNEVRKEKWIRKRMRRTMGAAWREQSGYERQPFISGTMSQLNDWTDVNTGMAGAPTLKQKAQRKRMVELAQDIYDAAKMVEKAKKL